MALIDKLTAIADAIRDKISSTESLTLDQMATEISEIEVAPATAVVTLNNQTSESWKIFRVNPSTGAIALSTLASGASTAYQCKIGGLIMMTCDTRNISSVTPTTTGAYIKGSNSSFSSSSTSSVVYCLKYAITPYQVSASVTMT